MTTFTGRRPNGLRLPLDPVWKSEDEYIQSVLTLATTSHLFRNLCGGVHILDFLTREPDLYTTVLPQEWRDWFQLVDIQRVLDVLMRDDLDQYHTPCSEESPQLRQRPPASLLEYIRTIRVHSLRRTFDHTPNAVSTIPPHVSVGMKTKKVHEVAQFAAYVGSLCNHVTSEAEANPNQSPLSIVDFGSGQNYLGRTLASAPYNKNVIAIEKRHHNIQGAKGMDVHAKLAKKEVIMRNKKEWKRRLAAQASSMPTPPRSEGEDDVVPNEEGSPSANMQEAKIVGIEFEDGKGSMTYLEHDIQDGHLEDILYPSRQTTNSPPSPSPAQDQLTLPPSQQKHPKAMVISLHSCGNLTHHALRSLPENPSIKAVAVIGCCYNLLTERLGPTTYKHPQLRPNHPRLIATGSTYDPHGFPMSKTLENFEAPVSNPGEEESGSITKGVRLNITARMMAVQAPQNWGPIDSETFFRRHFYRTLLQRILLDVGVVKQCPDPGMPSQLSGGSITGRDESGTPLIVGTLPKKAFTDVQTYVSAALEKLCRDPVDGDRIAALTKDVVTPDVVAQYESRFGYAKKNLAVIWSLMAFSAGVVESIIVTDRWLFLRELDCVSDCWVDVVFDYWLSPRNFVVVGIKKAEDEEQGEG